MKPEIVETLDGTWMVLVNGFQWGPPGSKADRSGAYDTTWSTRREAIEAFEAHSSVRDVGEEP